MSSTIINEKTHVNTKTDVLLAEKTLEIVRVIEMSDLLIKTKFNNDTACWMDAMFHILMLRNSAYLWEERNTRSETQQLCQKINDNLFEVNSEMEASKRNTGEYDKKTYSDFILTSISLIKLFSKFTNLLVKNDGITIDGNDVLDETKLILKNIAKFMSKYERDSAIKAADAPEISNSCSEPQPSVMLPTTSTYLSAGNTHGDNNTKIRNVSNKVMVASENGESELKKNFIPYNNPIFSKMNKKIQSKDTNTDASNVTQMSNTSTFSFDPKPVRSLSEGDRSPSVNSLDKNIPNLDSVDAIKIFFNSSLGDKSSAIEIRSNRDFYCKLCSCEISAPQNVIVHTSGRQHLLALKMKKGRTAKQKSESQPTATENIEGNVETTSTSSSDQCVLQVSTASISVKHLELS